MKLYVNIYETEEVQSDEGVWYEARTPISSILVELTENEVSYILSGGDNWVQRAWRHLEENAHTLAEDYRDQYPPKPSIDPRNFGMRYLVAVEKNFAHYHPPF